MKKKVLFWTKMGLLKMIPKCFSLQQGCQKDLLKVEGEFMMVVSGTLIIPVFL